MDIATGQAEDHPTPLPLDASSLPGVAPVTPITPGPLDGPTYSARDTTGEFQSQRLAGEADVRAAQAEGMSAEDDRRGRYADDMEPLGASYGDEITLPEPPPYNMYFPESNP